MPDDTVDIYINPDGSMQMVYSDEGAALFEGEPQQTRRASHVEPCGPGGWVADMGPVGGPVLTGLDGKPFRTRAAALAAERIYLELRMREGTLEIK